MNRITPRKKRQLPSSDEDDISADEQTNVTPDDDDDGEDEIDIEDDDGEGEVDDADDDEEEMVQDERDDDEELRKDDAASDASNSSIPKQPRLKIKLKLPALPLSSASNSVTPVPEENRKTARTKRRRPAITEYADDNDEDGFDDALPSSVTSAPMAATPKGGRSMTTRQAVLASVVDPSHVSLDGDGSSSAGNKGKKKQLNETELALRREETARKRRNLTEKKLEDEKLETINRLLKKQTRTRGKKQASIPQASTPKESRNSPGLGDDEDTVMDVDEEGTGTKSPPRAPSPPTMYRWVSSSRPAEESSSNENAPLSEEKTMTITFSVPPSLLSEIPPKIPDPTEPKVEHKKTQASSAACDVEGCSLARKYRLVKDWTRGACGMAHLKVLEAAVMDV